MPRPIWSGSISFGLVTVPVKLFTAVSRKTVSFNQIDSRSGSRIKYRKVSAADGEEVPAEAITKGYELPDGRFVLVGDDEIGALDPAASRTIDIEEFVELDQIDPVFYDAAYLVAPDKATIKPYALLARAMEETGKVGIARFVMRSKQYLCAIRPKDGHLVLSTMVYADEVNDSDDIAELQAVSETELPAKELQMARQLVESLAGDFEAERFTDTHREKIMALIERKAEGDTGLVEAPEAEAAAEVVDLMAALEASVAAAKDARKRHPTSGDGEADEGEGEAKAPKKAVRKKKSA